MRYLNRLLCLAILLLYICSVASCFMHSVPTQRKSTKAVINLPRDWPLQSDILPIGSQIVFSPDTGNVISTASFDVIGYNWYLTLEYTKGIQLFQSNLEESLAKYNYYRVTWRDPKLYSYETTYYSSDGMIWIGICKEVTGYNNTNGMPSPILSNSVINLAVYKYSTPSSEFLACFDDEPNDRISLTKVRSSHR
jgi:hypothetical protein